MPPGGASSVRERGSRRRPVLRHQLAAESGRQDRGNTADCRDLRSWDRPYERRRVGRRVTCPALSGRIGDRLGGTKPRVRVRSRPAPRGATVPARPGHRPSDTPALRPSTSTCTTRRGPKIAVYDNGGEPPTAAGPAPGVGFAGMSERATALGGYLHAGPGPDWYRRLPFQAWRRHRLTLDALHPRSEAQAPPVPAKRGLFRPPR